MGNPVDQDQAGDTESEQNGGYEECPAQPTGGVETAMAPERDDDVAIKIGGLPAGQTAPDFCEHYHFDQAATGSADQTASRKYLSEQDQRQKDLAEIRRPPRRSGFNALDVSHYLTAPIG